jgi:hypothetical protein
MPNATLDLISNEAKAPIMEIMPTFLSDLFILKIVILH